MRPVYFDIDTLKENKSFQNFAKVALDNSPELSYLKGLKDTDTYKSFPDEKFLNKLGDTAAGYIVNTEDGIETLPYDHFSIHRIENIATWRDLEAKKHLGLNNYQDLVDRYPIDLPSVQADERARQIEADTLKPSGYLIDKAVEDWMNITNQLIVDAAKDHFKDIFGDFIIYLSAKSPPLTELTDKRDEHGFPTYYRDRVETMGEAGLHLPMKSISSLKRELVFMFAECDANVAKITGEFTDPYKLLEPGKTMTDTDNVLAEVFDKAGIRPTVLEDLSKGTNDSKSSKPLNSNSGRTRTYLKECFTAYFKENAGLYRNEDNREKHDSRIASFSDLAQAIVDKKFGGADKSDVVHPASSRER